MYIIGLVQQTQILPFWALCNLFFPNILNQIWLHPWIWNLPIWSANSNHATATIGDSDATSHIHLKQT